MKSLSKHKNDIINVLTLIIISLVTILVLVNFTNFFGSKKDWISQHIMFPDYLRKLFYDTGDIFPNFAFNLGGGQNIYNISYYGLFNPIILISYLLPFVSMITYIQFSMIICLIVSIILMYYFLRRRFDLKVSFVSTLLFLTSGCLIFHLHRHIMFVDYMPFLLMALIGVDKYFDKKKIPLLVISIFLMILTSYYFSVVGLVCILLYGIFRYIEDKRNDKITVKDFFREGFKFIFIMLIPVLLSCFLLLPTAYSLLDGRTATNKSISLLGLFIPNFDISNTLYSSYSLGCSAIFIIALIYGVVTKKREVKVISIIFSILLVFPIFDYVFNGGMYLNGKAFIPLLPLAILLIGYFLMNIFNNKSKLKISIIISLIIAVINLLVFIYKREYLCLLFCVDMVLLIIFLLISYKLEKKYVFYIYLGVMSLVLVIPTNFSDIFVTKEFYDTLDYEETSDKVKKVLDNDNSFYRMSDQSVKLDKSNYIYDVDYYTGSIYSSLSNSYYKDFYNNLINNEFIYRSYGMLTGNNNIFYNFYMGNKYLLNSSNNMLGYKKIADGIYRNEDVLPIGYSTNKIMSLDEYNSLSYFEKLDAYLNYAIVDEDYIDSYVKKVKDYVPSYDVLESKNLKIEEDSGKYFIKASKDNKLVIKLNNISDSDILLLKFKMLYNSKCSVGDSYITINGVSNKLSCRKWKYHNNNYNFEYSLSGKDTLEITFSEGKFKLSNLSFAIYNYNDLMSINDEISPFVIDRDKTKGDVIEGNIDVKNDGYFKLSIPYDKGFEVYVDGEKTPYEVVNKSFIGFKINEGNHNIKLVYVSPLFKEGLIVSCVGLVLFVGTVIYYKKKKKTVD
ncbi:MAG TPA: YfhO family protein [Candidatus Onthousia excrementipullorum]|uniref:YfhO family protein n=1 Tax=Candidatus Onthousia excrementipullorum TaxID=2840884 RepID=A0A9D1DTN2_9FIRM|nr:YfhO family protein [Candidatus Onthousia excrementipullorum]